MVPAAVDVDVEASPSTFPLLMERESPLVLRQAVTCWSSQSFLQNPGAKNLRTTWRIHPLGLSTVLEADCRFLEASVYQFLEWERSTELLPPSNPFAPYDRKNHWAYADYKHVKELGDDWAKALETVVDWSALGCEKTASDSTLWFGTGGSHTPLHYDTYGVNLVAQLHGRKKWLLFPPAATASLSPTRVPYEESSVFSQIDARSPDIRRFPRYDEANAVAVTLEPGDILFVPKHWWHFVEAVETSLSVNVWVDAPDDSEDRAKESVARVLMTSLASGLETEVGPAWLNPTEGEVWPLEETLAVASLAFQGLNPDANEAASGDGDRDDGEARVLAGDAFSVRAMVDAVTAPDILQMIANRMLHRKG